MVTGISQASAQAAVRVELTPADPVILHGAAFERSDANSPLRVEGDRTLLFVSHYQPIGHTYRRIGGPGLRFAAPLERVTLLDDPQPEIGKWIESVWRDPAGRLYGWYHAEDVFFKPNRLFIPRIGALASDDDGRRWRFLAPLLDAPETTRDFTYANGFLAGGYGDFCVLADEAGRYFYIYYSSYVADEAAQGICVARYPVAERDSPSPQIELWRCGAWRPMADGLASPLWPTRKGWRHPDPDAFWGPAIHYNHALGLYVMLLNHTQNGHADIMQEGIYISFASRLDDPAGWSAPVRILRGGGWYPQAIGEQPGDGDTSAGAEPRFFMTGFSAWKLRFIRDGGAQTSVDLSWQDLLARFADRSVTP
ncbi:MAG TPA: hypothetical protein VFS04_09515 [Alphaproteobacteria bacterium]|nr:hypothetical protein [Alphaproteobacteria bacterium]